MGGLFWGVILKPEKRYEQIVEEDFRITKACVDPSTLDKGKVVSVILEKDNEEYIICNLTSPNGLDQPMDLAFAVGEKVVFRTEGGATVHLTGHVQPADDMPGYPGYEMDSDDEVVEEEGEEEESSDDEEEETPPKLVKKRKLENGTENVKSAKKQKGEAVKQAEAMKKILSKEKPKVAGDEEDDDSDDDDMYEDMGEAEGDSSEEESEEESEEQEESSPEQATPKAKKDKKPKEAQQSSPAKNGQTPKKDGKKAEK